MSLDASMVFLSQTATTDMLATTTWPGLILALLGGGVGVTFVHRIIAEHLREKRELAKQLASEEKHRRDAKLKAEVEQLEALTTMARSVPEQFASMGKRWDALASELVESHRMLSTKVDGNTKELAEVRREMASDTRALVSAIAGKLGVQTNSDEPTVTARRSSPGEPHASP